MIAKLKSMLWVSLPLGCGGLQKGTFLLHEGHQERGYVWYWSEFRHESFPKLFFFAILRLRISS